MMEIVAEETKMASNEGV